MEATATELQTPANELDLFSQSTSLEVITFMSGETTYAIPVDQVRYIEQDKRKTTKIDSNQGGREVTSYQNKPVPIYDFSTLIGQQSEYQENIATIELLNQRQKEHEDWISDLEQCLSNQTEFTRPRSAHLCAFGQWYDTYKPSDKILSAILKDFEAPHRKIHALADTLLNMVKNDQREEAISRIEIEKKTTLRKLSELFRIATDRLESITRPILVYLDHGERPIAIRLNAISDIVTFNKSQFSTSEDVAEQPEVIDFISGYLYTNADEAPSVLLDWRAFIPAKLNH
jgi:chemotaxis signal transduction protein